jgi:vancomycin resistance protein VanJ
MLTIWQRIQNHRTWLGLLLLYGLSVLQAHRPARRGLRALAAVFAPYGLLPILLLVPVTRRREDRVVLLATAMLYAMEHLPLRQRHLQHRRCAAASFSVLTWNIRFSNPQPDAMFRFLATTPAAIVALQELTTEHIARIRHDPALVEQYPYQIAWPHGYGAGMALLSRYPILEHGRLERPPTLWARLDLDDGRQVVLVSAHPTFFPPKMAAEEPQAATALGARMRRLLDARFLRYNPDYRDDGIRRVRSLVDRLRHEHAPLLVVGDFNVTEREPAYQELTAGLQDAQRYAGSGSGLTWRPEWLASLPVPILRIDYMVNSPDLQPLHITVDRTPRGSDHCIVYGEFELTDDSPAQ